MLLPWRSPPKAASQPLKALVSPRTFQSRKRRASRASFPLCGCQGPHSQPRRSRKPVGAFPPTREAGGVAGSLRGLKPLGDRSLTDDNARALQDPARSASGEGGQGAGEKTLTTEERGGKRGSSSRLPVRGGDALRSDRGRLPEPVRPVRGGERVGSRFP